MPKQILMIGDSTFRGWGAGDVNYYTNSRINSLPVKIAEGFTANGNQTSSESRIGSGKWNNATELEAADPAIDVGGWSFFNGTGNSIGGYVFQYNTPPMFIDFVGDTAFLLACDFSGNGVIRFRVDGGAWEEHDLNTAATTLNHVPITLVSGGAHTIEIDKTAASNSNVFYSGVLAYTAADAGVIVPIAANGYQSIDYTTTGFPWLTYDAMDSFTFDVVIFNTGINDILQSVAQVDFESRYTTFINKIKSINPSVQLYFVIPNDIQVGLGYVPASVTNLASTLGATVIDSTQASNFSDYTTANNAGLMDDIWHPNAAGYQVLADYYVSQIQGEIFPPPPASGGFCGGLSLGIGIGLTHAKCFSRGSAPVQGDYNVTDYSIGDYNT